MIEAIQTSEAPAAIGPYSQAIAVPAQGGRWLFLSGQIPLDPESGHLVQGDTATQTHRVMQNLRAVLRAAGGDLHNLVKVGIFVSDLNDFAAINAVYASYLEPPYPARATVEVRRLPRDVSVEIDGVAWIA
jgi:2-iminobutanoate/2-iminopropanoate deaminase